jgi:hypothetical protein
VCLLVYGFCAAAARADGDPASDVLSEQTLYLPSDAGVTANQQAQLASLLAVAGRAGYQLRVALVASQADLGSIPALWRQPQKYALFLGYELSLLYHGVLLVVMPNGYGLYRSAGLPSVEASALAATRAPGQDLGTAALTAIQRLAGASGHPLQLPHAIAPTPTSTEDTASWLAFAIGAALIALAWTASLRARPLRVRSPRTSAS